MGEAKAKSRSRAAILAQEARCIYCAAAPTSLEHMPPRSMFKNKMRPSGLEFATCTGCNNGSSGADLVASFFARMRADDDVQHWQIQEMQNLKASLEHKATGVLSELFREEKSSNVLRRTRGGVLVPAVEVHADGPLLRSYLDVFSAKLGMALYREHLGEPLPLEGAVYSQWHLNGGLAQDAAHAMLSILPAGATLQQGAFHVDLQFAYRFNCDNRSIVAALTRFHEGLFVFIVATSEPKKYLSNTPNGSTSAITRPGQIIGGMPALGDRYWK